MSNIQEVYSQIGIALAGHFDSLYYVDIESGHYVEYVHMSEFESIGIPTEGEDFFSESQENARNCIHPDDLDHVIRIHDRNIMLKRPAEDMFI